MTITLQDVATHSGFSTKTVSRVINGEKQVAERTRRTVLESIAVLGYVPNVWAQRLARGQSGLVGLFMHDATPAYIVDVINGLMDRGNELGYDISVHRLDVRERRQVDRVIAMSARSEVDGFVFTPPCDSSSELTAALQDLGFPFVLLSPHERCDDCAWVSATDEIGSYHAAAYLIELGHSRIGFIQGSQDHQASWDRLRGYERALSEHGIGSQAELVLQGNWTFESGLSRARQLLALPSPPTAIMAANDDAAAGVMQAAWERGLRCPRDLSVVGFDDVPLARQMTPPLTTVRQPIYEMAYEAMSMLVNELIPGTGTGITKEVPTELVIRHSTTSVR